MFKFDKKTSNTIKMTDKSRSKINSAETILKSIKIPVNFENSEKITGSIRLLNAASSGVKKANGTLNNKINELIAIGKRKINTNNDLSNILFLGLNGYTYDELDGMKYDDLNKMLSDMIFNSNNIQNLRNPLDDNNDPIEESLRDKFMYRLTYRIINKFTEDSVCQGGAYLDEKTIAYCDIDSNQEAGKICIVKKGLSGKITGRVITTIDVNGHSNDITYIKNDRIIIHPDHDNNKIDLYKLDENYNVIEQKTIKNKNADAIAYDSKKDKIIAINGVDAEVYSRESYLRGDKKPEKKFKVADQIWDTKDKKNTTYYDYRAGATAHDGNLYVSYAGFENHVTGNDTHHYGEEKGNMITVLDYEDGGSAVGYIKDDIKQEIESVDLNEKGNIVTWHNYGPKTRVFEAENVNAYTIASQYNLQKQTKLVAKK